MACIRQLLLGPSLAFPGLTLPSRPDFYLGFVLLPRGAGTPPDARGIIPFDFKENRVRVAIHNGEPLFMAEDVTDILGYANGRKACADHCKAAVPDGVTIRDAMGRVQKSTGIPERDVYRLVMRSHLPAAEEFEEWVVGTVLSSIRKNGGYTAGQEKLLTGEMTPEELMARALLAANATIADAQQARRLAEELATTALHQEHQLQEQWPPRTL
jgi:prophage antirepressor-like protein